MRNWVAKLWRLIAAPYQAEGVILLATAPLGAEMLV